MYLARREFVLDTLPCRDNEPGIHEKPRGCGDKNTTDTITQTPINQFINYMATRINLYGKEIRACGYHEDERGKKFIKIVATLSHVCVKVKLQKGKTLHIIADEPHFKYSFVGNFVQFTINFGDMQEWCMHAEIDKQLNKIWFD